MENSLNTNEEVIQSVTENVINCKEMKNDSEKSEEQELIVVSDGKEGETSKEENCANDNSKDNKDAEKITVAKRRPMSTKSTRSSEFKEKEKKKRPIGSGKGKHIVKRRSSSSDIIKKKPHIFHKKVTKKLEKSKQNGNVSSIESSSQQCNSETDSKRSTEEETLKLKDTENRPQSSSSKNSEKNAGNGCISVESDNKEEKLNSTAHENSSKRFGIKKTWQRIKSVKEKGLISSQGNGTLPSGHECRPIIPDKEKHETVLKKDDQGNETKETLTPEVNQILQDCPVNEASSQQSAEPTVQYGNGNKYAEDEKTKALVVNSDPYIHSAIPYLPLQLSVICLVMNIFLPGSGTVLSGFAILFCGETRIQTKEDQKTVTLCVNLSVGVSQLFTVTFLLVGWFWSLAWGIKLVTLSVEYKRHLKQKRERELQVIALKAFGSSMQVRPMFSVVTE
ncbi:uncharacterized protein LOC133178084 [Saccostrea echinata]|uniref:uncharacterized protein LOC133178084 n=1 Tax=Saccostrea echinata TaxID=191078 RepID=UPI002A81A48F|nr:uncharacterized protein LOC133178084 [Saccostrea echinata]